MKKHPLHVVSLFTYLILSVISFGQGQQVLATDVVGTPDKCASAIIHEQRMQTDPQYAQMQQQFEEFMAHNTLEKVGGQYRVPVVVHIVHYAGGLGAALGAITDNQIRDAIMKLNKQMRNLNGLGVDADIEFSLAVRDPSGNCTTGITRDNVDNWSANGYSGWSATVLTNYKNNGVQAISSNGITDAQMKAVNQWPSNQYFNIWLTPEFDNNGGGAGVQGYASFASAHGTTSDGSVMLGLDFLNPLSTTLVHELGHSFNLYHTFEGDNGGGSCPPTTNGCGTNQGDCCADVPPHRRSNSDCNSSGTNSCNSNSSNSLFVFNYMDYSSCTDRFTANQVSRMQTAASVARGSFLAANGNNKLVPPTWPGASAIRASNTFVCSGSTIQLFDATSCTPNDFLNQSSSFPGFTYSWSITNGSQTYTSTNQNPVFTPAVGVYTVTFTVTHSTLGTATSTTPNAFTVVAAPVTSCTATSTNTGNYGQAVTNVTFGTINHTTSQLTTEGYINWMCTLNTQVTASSTYPISIGLIASGSGVQNVRVHVDWNNDGDFSDAGESNIVSGATANNNSSTTVTGNITIPAAAATGVLLRMRVSGVTTQTANACGTFSLADIADYGLYVAPSVSCPTLASQPSASTACSGTNTSFVATFNNSPTSFQWELSTDGGTNWANVTNGGVYSNATTATLNITGATVGMNNYRYRCRGTNSCGSATSNAAILTVNASPGAPTISAGSSTTFCSGGSVVLTSSSATGNTWSTGATTQSITVSTAGTYTVTQTASGCTSPNSAGTTVTVNPTPGAPTISAGSSTTFCSGGSVVLTSSAASGNTWSTGATTQSITVSTAGTYTVTQTASGCTSPNSAGTTVTVNPTPGAPTISAGGATTFCSGGSVVLTSSASSGNTWSTGATTQSITVSTAGTYTVTQTVSGCTSPASSATTVTVNPTPAITAGTLTNPSTCSSSNGSIQVNGSGTGNLTWSGTSSGSLNGVSLPQTVGSLAAGSYNFTFTSAAGCPSNILNASLTNPSAPSAPTISSGSSTTFCSGGSVVLTSSASSGNTWSTGATTQSITVSTSGTYTVTQTVSGCTSSNSAGTTVTVNPTPSAPTINAGSSTTFCSGGSVVLTSSSATGNTWSTGATTQSITVSTSGTYTVTRTVSGCTSPASSATTVTVNPTPSAPTINAGSSTTFCSGGSVVLTSSSATGNTWSTGATTQSITVSTAGTYTVTQTASGCTSSNSAGTTVTVNPTPGAPTISAGGATTFCSGGSVVLTSSAASGNTWSTGATTQSITVSTSGTYTVTQTASGCTSPNSTGTTVVVSPTPGAPTISAGGATTFCSGGSVVLTSSAASGNTWSTGATTQSITVSSSGTYTVNQTASGCTSSNSTGTTVVVNPAPGISQGTLTNPTTCSSNNGSIQVGGSGTGNLSWSGAVSGSLTNVSLPQTISSLPAGNYSVSFTSGAGCTSNTLTITLTNPSAPSAPTISNGGVTTFCQGGSVVLTSSASSGNTWSNGATTPSITVTSSGTYSVTQTVSGCTSPSSSSVTVTVNPIPNAPTITPGGPTTICSGQSVTLTSSASSGNTWSTNATTSVISVTASGTYTVTETANGCVSPPSTGITVTVNPMITPSFNAVGPYCAGTTIPSLPTSSTNGVNGSWSPAINNLATTTYTFTPGVGQCANNTSLSIVVNPLPNVSFSAIGDQCIYSGDFILTQGQPAGGTYTGNGVSGGQFSPSSAGLGSSTITYTFTDNNGCTNTAQSTVDVSECLSVSNNNSLELLVYPNPGSGLFTIQVAGNLEKAKIIVYDQFGKLVKQVETSEVLIPIDLSLLAKGVYTIKVDTETGSARIPVVLQ